MLRLWLSGDLCQLVGAGYSDEQIIALIDATDSVFDLEAEDLPRLKRLGVNEAIIRRMLERAPPRSPTPAGEARPRFLPLRTRRSPSLAELARERTVSRPAPADSQARPVSPASRRDLAARASDARESPVASLTIHNVSAPTW